MSAFRKIENFKRNLEINQVWWCEGRKVKNNRYYNGIPECQKDKGEYHFIMVIDKLGNDTPDIIIKHLDSGLVEKRHYTFIAQYQYHKLKEHNHPPRKKEDGQQRN